MSEVSVRPASPEEEGAIAAKRAFLMRCLMASDSIIPKRPSSASEWTIALILLAGDIIREAPANMQGAIIEECQRLLLRGQTTT